MKKIFSMITLAVLMVALAGSCTKNIEERIDKADTDVAALQAAIGQYEKLQSDITSVIQALRNEVGSRPASEQQTVWECIAALQSQNNTVSAAIGGLKTLVGEESVSGQIDDAVSELISKYNLESLEATLKGLKDEVARKFNVEALKGQVEQLDKTLRKCSNYIARIDAFKGLVQSVSIIPDYDDGSVKVDDGVITLMCVITPESVLSDISNPYEIFTLTLSYGPATKFGESEEICFDDIQPYDRERGIVLFTANISKYIPEDDSQTLMVSLNVKFGGSNLTSGFAKVTSVPDLDGDGVPNSIDECPDTPAGVAVDEKGCPVDSDGDEVADYLDKCPGTPAGVQVDANGCPLDSDGDGVPDYLDQCPGTPAEAYGMIDENGCPLDSDGDGVADYLDKCPGSPAAAKGFVDENGCPTDADSDGVYDYEDNCPETPGIKENKGCPEIK